MFTHTLVIRCAVKICMVAAYIMNDASPWFLFIFFWENLCYSSSSSFSHKHCHILPFNSVSHKQFPGWWFQPLWNILVNGKDYPTYEMENKKSLKPPISDCYHSLLSQNYPECNDPNTHTPHMPQNYPECNNPIIYPPSFTDLTDGPTRAVRARASALALGEADSHASLSLENLSWLMVDVKYAHG